jgi:hypothetical protein
MASATALILDDKSISPNTKLIPIRLGPWPLRRIDGVVEPTALHESDFERLYFVLFWKTPELVASSRKPVLDGG